MWYVDKLFEQPLIESLSAKGFLVRSSGGVARIEKYGCGAELRKTPEGLYQMTVIPSIMFQGQFTRLWDAGYQKFLLTHDGRKIPVRVNQLLEMRRFNEELRAALGVPAYYNEALGSTCHVSVYDRVKGRPGDVPDETVGVHKQSDH
jgi:ribosomal protein L2